MPVLTTQLDDMSAGPFLAMDPSEGRMALAPKVCACAYVYVCVCGSPPRPRLCVLCMCLGWVGSGEVGFCSHNENVLGF